jgi:hypothetical protein
LESIGLSYLAERWLLSIDVALTPSSGHLTRENVYYGKITSGVHS